MTIPRHPEGNCRDSPQCSGPSNINLREEKMKPVSQIGFNSLVNESKLTYTEDCCQTVEEHLTIAVQVPRLIVIEIPIVIYKVKEKVITYDESDL
jgi:hypothetical protein